MFDDGDTLLFSFMGKHLSLDSVTDTIDVWYLCLPVVVDDNLTTIIHLDSSFLESETASEGVSSDTDEDDVDIEDGLSTVLGANQVKLDTILFVVHSRSDLGVHFEGDALLLERLMESLAELSVKEGADTVGVLDDSDIRAKSLVNTTELESDNSTTNDCHLLRDLFE